MAEPTTCIHWHMLGNIVCLEVLGLSIYSRGGAINIKPLLALIWGVRHKSLTQHGMIVGLAKVRSMSRQSHGHSLILTTAADAYS